MKPKLLCILSGVLIFTSVHGQKDTTETRHITSDQWEMLEQMAENSEGEIDYSDLTGNPDEKLNINTASREDLRMLGLLSELQIRCLYDYVRIYGNILSTGELKAIDHFDDNTIKQITPYISIGPGEVRTKYNFPESLRYAGHDLIIRSQQSMEREKGYDSNTDSAFLSKPGSYFLGSPVKLYTRYRFQAAEKVTAGFLAEKDAGEVFLDSRISDSLLHVAGISSRNGFDHYSGFLSLKESGIFENITLGDYHLQFGQGLTMWSNMVMGKGGTPSGNHRFARGIIPTSSSEENRFFRGIAMQLNCPFDMKSTLFFSSKPYDANLETLTDTLDKDEYTIATSLQESGLHRTLTELAGKHNLKISMGGGNINFQGERIKTGITGYYTVFNHPIGNSGKVYDLYDFTGKQAANIGMDISYLFKKLILFGEMAGSNPGGLACLAGFTAKPSGSSELCIIYRNYEKSYQAMFSNAFGEGSASSNEKGLYGSFLLAPVPKVSLNTYIDQYYFPWLKYRVNAPSAGAEYYLGVNYSLSRSAGLKLSYRYKWKEQNTDGDNLWHPEIRSLVKQNYRFQFNWGLQENWSFQSRIDYVRNATETDASITDGCLVSQDISWKNGNKLAIHLRYALFNTDTYLDRLYSYEHDVLYSFSIPAYYYNGTRSYFLVKYRISRFIDTWFRISRTSYYDRNTTGSGISESNSNHKTSVSLQIRIHI